MTESLSDKPLTGQKGVREKNDEVLAESATLPLSDYRRVARDPTRIADWTCRISGKHYPTRDVVPIACFQGVLRLSHPQNIQFCGRALFQSLELLRTDCTA